MKMVWDTVIFMKMVWDTVIFMKMVWDTVKYQFIHLQIIIQNSS